jgi:REP element-mobilizing transposase RayT
MIIKDIRNELYAYMGGILKSIDSTSIIINGTSDHVHILFRLSKTHALCEVIETVKKQSSKWIKTKGKQFELFQWQGGYGAFSVSESSVKHVMNYIQNQEQHHSKISFKEELQQLLDKHGVKYNPDYLWT